MLYPLAFTPIFKPRVWGSETWTVSDRPGDESVVLNGAMAGRTLAWLMTHHRHDLLGSAPAAVSDRFPLLCKILECRETLSVQVHPPADVATALGGEPKTEMWYVAEATPDAALYVGLAAGVTKEEFQRRLGAGTVERALHKVPVRKGDTMFLPSGRVHAIGGGLVIFEIQQNSDTTYRVFDWNRVGLDGRPRELHVEQSLASIRFDDYEPSLADTTETRHGAFLVRRLVRDPLFDVDLYRSGERGHVTFNDGAPRVLAALDGVVTVAADQETLRLSPGQFCVLPAVSADATVNAESSQFLVVRIGDQGHGRANGAR